MADGIKDDALAAVREHHHNPTFQLPHLNN
jgi:hypothetical protein